MPLLNCFGWPLEQLFLYFDVPLLNCFVWPLEQLFLYFDVPVLNCFGWPLEQLFLYFDVPVLNCFGWPLEQLFWFPGGSLKDSRLSHQFCEVKPFTRKLNLFFVSFIIASCSEYL